MFSSRYLGYLNSPAWFERRKKALRRANFECQICGRRRRLQVHHLSYANLGNERNEDLTVLCFLCHVFVTLGTRLKRILVKIAGFIIKNISKVLSHR